MFYTEEAEPCDACGRMLEPSWARFFYWVIPGLLINCCNDSCVVTAKAQVPQTWFLIR